MSESETVSLLVDAGEAKPSGAIAPALGPLGLNLVKVVADINTATANFKGMKVPVNVVINTTTRDYKIEVGLPPTSALVLNQLGIPKGSGKSGHEVISDMKFEQVLNVAHAKRSDLLAASLPAAVKEVLGTIVTMGITIEGKDARVIQKDIDKGKYDKQFDKFQE